MDFTYNYWGRAVDRKCLWGFDYNSAKNVVIFGVDNSSWSHTYIKKRKLSSIKARTNFWY